MSKLGKVYVICINREKKDIYPVVYANKEFLYCKQYGTCNLNCYSNPDYPRSHTMHYADFKEAYERGEIDKARTYSVYVPAHIKTFFEWIKAKTPLEKEIERVEMNIKEYKRMASIHQQSRDRHSKDMEHYLQLVDRFSGELVELLKQAQDENKEVCNNG